MGTQPETQGSSGSPTGNFRKVWGSEWPVCEGRTEGPERTKALQVM